MPKFFNSSLLYGLIFKRFLDFAVALTLLILLSPIILIIGAVLAKQNKGTPFFFQERPGKDKKPFQIIKFKTMTDDRDDKGELLPDKQRITPLGKFVRKWSLDELPQLFNVIKGDMSLIGPRPLLFKYLPLYSEEQNRRHEVRPGITGWAQVNGRNAISWRKKFELDVYYVDHLSFLLDFKIFWLTLVKILARTGIDQSSERPMQPFDGTN
jgi:lipopolysaccharide/colanic/teichoic acid biosynthesis glycosyltransferase